MLSDKTVELINRIREHAHTHYEEDGWDILAECWSVNDILDCIGDADTFEEAIIRISDTLSIIDGYRAEIQAEAF
jgi:predicted RNase H-like HicB family nuclease